MAIAGKLLRAIVYAAAKVGVKKIAYAGGSPFGVGTLAEGAVDFSISFIEDVCKSFGGSSRENAARLPIGEALDPAAQRELKTQIAETAQASAEQTQIEMNAAIDEIAPTLPEAQREQLLADREALVAYAAMLPDRVRRTLQRADDPTGRTLPAEREIRTPLDLAEFLPPMPRFRPGDCPVYNRRLVRVLGVGTFGEVWEATKVGMQGKRVALKFCLADDAALVHEARLAQRLDHPGIVQLLDVHPRSGDVPLCLEYEFVDSVDLATWALSRTDTTAETWPAAVAEVIAELAEIVHVAHAHVGDDGRAEPIVHRDLKPANVLVPRVTRSARVARGMLAAVGEHVFAGGAQAHSTPRFKITDFGIGAIVRVAETAHQATVKRTLTRYGSSYTLDALGAHTPKYAPDEQIAGGKPDPRNDVHALGVIWYQMLRRDFLLPAPRGGGWKRQLRAFGVVDGQIELIERCVDSDPAERPTNGAALAEEIRRVGTAHHSPPSAHMHEGPNDARATLAETSNVADARDSSTFDDLSAVGTSSELNADEESVVGHAAVSLLIAPSISSDLDPDVVTSAEIEIVSAPVHNTAELHSVSNDQSGGNTTNRRPSDMNVVRCAQCGSDVPEQARFCPKCGRTVGEVSSSADSNSGSAAEADDFVALFTKLVELGAHLHEGNLSVFDRGLDSLREIVKLVGDRVISLSASNWRARHFERLVGCPSLASLTILGDKLDDECIQYITRLRSLRTLDLQCVHGKRFTGNGLMLLSKLPQLEVLKLPLAVMTADIYRTQYAGVLTELQARMPNTAVVC